MPRMQNMKGSLPVITYRGITGVAVTAASSFQVNPSGLGAIATRYLADGDAFNLFRMLSFKFRIHAPTSAGGVDASSGASPLTDTPPATVNAIMELRDSVFHPAGQTTPSKWVSVGKDVLAGPLPWYKTINGSTDLSEETPFYWQIKQSTALLVYYEIEFTVQFKDAVAPANTPMAYAALLAARDRRLEALRAKEQTRLLQALAKPNPPPAGPTGATPGGAQA